MRRRAVELVRVLTDERAEFVPLGVGELAAELLNSVSLLNEEI